MTSVTSMTSDPDATRGELSDEDRAALLRWRLALGPEAEAQGGAPFGLDAGERAAEAVGIDPRRVGELDATLGFVYDERPARGAGGARRPSLPSWLASLRELFSREVVAVVQRDAIDRKGLTELLFQPETLPLLERNVELVATILQARALVPDAARDAARAIVAEVVEELRRRLEAATRTAVLGAVRRDRRSPIRVLRNLDWQRTIRANLKTWDRERRRLRPERLAFAANQRRRHEWDVVLLVDQSASMAESAVYAAVMAAIFASLDVLRTRLVFFDTDVVDVTELLGDPVDVLFSLQLGGGTDIQRAVAYAEERLVERPERTLVILISDLFEGGDRQALVARLRRLVESRARALALLALTDGGRPAYDHELARELVEVGVPAFGCTPKLLVDVVERALRGDDLGALVTG